MAGFLFSVKKSRKELVSLLNRWEKTLVALECGLELGYAWEAAGGRRESCFTATHPLAQTWLLGLADLHREGAPLVPYVLAFTGALRDHLRREMEDHERTLPFRLNLILLVFSLPPVFVLLFHSLLVAILEA